MTNLRNTEEEKKVWVECGEVVANAEPLNWAGILMHFPAAHSPPSPPTPFQPFRAILVISPIPAKAKPS